MLSDGEFTEEEQAEIGQVLDAYYAVVVQMQSNVEGRPLPPPDYRPATMEQLIGIYGRLKTRPAFARFMKTWQRPKTNTPNWLSLTKRMSGLVRMAYPTLPIQRRDMRR